jgi:hypothetical protein
VIQDNAALATRLSGFNLPTKEFFVLKQKKGMS